MKKRKNSNEIQPGTTFNRLTVVAEGPRSKYGHRRYFCRCECGQGRVVRGSSLRIGNSQSCGCLSRELTIKRNWVHGESSSKKSPESVEHTAWSQMRSRCSNRNNVSWKNYGGRGITVCDAWKKSFVTFLRDVGRKPDPSLTLERIDNDGNYEPGNVKWATPKEQANNRRPPRINRRSRPCA